MNTQAQLPSLETRRKQLACPYNIYPLEEHRLGPRSGTSVMYSVAAPFSGMYEGLADSIRLVTGGSPWLRKASLEEDMVRAFAIGSSSVEC